MRFRRAFTIVELLLVLAIVIILIGIGFPVLQRIRAQSQAAKCLSNLRQIGAGLNLYLADHGQRMPVLEGGRRSRDEDVAVLDTVLAEYLTDPRIFACPEDAKLARLTGTSYYWNVALNGQQLGSLNFFQLVDATSRIPILSDKEGWHRFSEKKVNILYADGHATRGLTF